MSEPSKMYLTYRAMWFEREANKFLSCGENEKAGALLQRAREYRTRAGELPFDTHTDRAEPEVVSCLPARCNACDTPIYVSIHDYSETANYCYPCAWHRLGDKRGKQAV